MAVQSQYAPTGILPDATTRNTRALGGTDDRSFGVNQNAFNLGKFQNPTAMNGSNQYRLFNQLAGGRHGYTPQLDASLLNGAEKQIAANTSLLNASRKRSREAEDLRTQWQQQQQ